MEIKNKLPQNYIPFDELNICSNRLIGGTELIRINGFTPILIGDGIVPSIWIFGKNENQQWTELIKESISLHSAIKIITDKINREIIIGIQDIIVLKGKITSNKVCEINTLNLRPIGFDIQAKEKTLTIANSNFSTSTFKDVGVLIEFSE